MKTIFKSVPLVLHAVLKTLFVATALALTVLLVGIVSTASVEEKINHYNEMYCVEVNQQYQMLQQGYKMPPKRERIIRSEMKKCKAVRAAYEKNTHPVKLTSL